MCRKLVLCAVVGMSVVSLATSPAAAATVYWTSAGGGSFSDGINWLSGLVPGNNDSAKFNLDSGYLVNFLDDATNHGLYVTAGAVTFASANPGELHTYCVTGGGGNAYITGGSLALGIAGRPLNLAVDNLLSVQNATLTVNFGSTASAASLRLGGTLNVTGGDILYGHSMLNIAGNADVDGYTTPGVLTLQAGALGTIGGTLNLAQSGPQGGLSVIDGATLYVGSINAATRDLPGPSQSSQILVDKNGTVVQTGNSSLTLGGNYFSTGTLNISNGGTFVTGTGTTTIQGGGSINVATAGIMRALGDVRVNTFGGAFHAQAPNINVTGTNTVFTQEGAGAFTIGAAAGTVPPPADVSVTSGGQLTTGTGDLTVNATGFIIVGDGRFVANGNIYVNTAGGAGFTNPNPNGNVYVTGSKASFVQNGATTLSIGHPSSGVGIVTIDNGATFTTGTGGTTIYKTGLIDLRNGGILNANGDVRVDGGALRCYGIFNQGAGTTVTAQNGGLLDFGGTPYSLNRGGTLNVISGATAMLSRISVAADPSAGNAGQLNIDSAAQVLFSELYVASQGSTPFGTVTLSGANSRLTQMSNGPIFIGQLAGGSAALNVNSGSIFTALGPVTIASIGSLNINGGILNASSYGLLVDGGKVTVTGNLNLAPASTVTVQKSGLLDYGSGSLTLDKAAIDVTSGTLKAGTLSVVGADNAGYGWAHFHSSTTSGSLGSINVAYAGTSGFPSSPMLLVDSGAQVTVAGSFDLASSGSGTVKGSVVVDGSGSKLTQTGSLPLTIGRWGLGAATLDVKNGATLTTAGPMTISQSGAVNVGVFSSGTFNAGGDVLVDGGKLTIGSGFVLGANKTLTAQNGGVIDLLGASYLVNQGSALNILSSAEMRNVGNLTVGATSNGSLLVDGSASTLTCLDLSVGTLGASSSAAFRNGAIASARKIYVAVDSTAGTAGQLTVDSGAQVTFSDALTLGGLGANATSGTVTVTGTGSKLTQAGGSSSVVIGQPSFGSGALNVNNGATFTANRQIVVGTTGNLNINGGSVNTSSSGLLIDGGKVTVAGNLNLPASTVTVQKSGLLDYGSGSLTLDKATVDTVAGTVKAGALSVAGGDGIGIGTAHFHSNTTTGSFNSINVAYAGATGFPPWPMLLVDTGAQVTVAGPFDVASSGSGTVKGSVVLDGTFTKLTQTGSSPLTIGRWGPGSATLTVQKGATLTTAGPMTINQSGVVNVGVDNNNGGTLNAGGDVLVDGGKLTAYGTFALGGARSLTAQNGGVVSLSLLGVPYVINQGSAVNVLSSAKLERWGNLTVGAMSNGSLLVDGAASTLTCADLSLGTLGASGSATFRNGAITSASIINVAVDSTAGTAGQLTVDSGAQVTFSDRLSVVANPGGTPSSSSGTVTVTGANSKLTQVTNGVAIYVGQLSGGPATLNVNNGGTFTALGPMFIARTGTVNISGGTVNTSSNYNGLLIDGGKVNVAGTLNLAPGSWVTVQNSGLLDYGSGSLILDKAALDTFAGTVKAGALSVTGGDGIGFGTAHFHSNTTTGSFNSINVAYTGSTGFPSSPMLRIDSGAQVTFSGPFDLASSGSGVEGSVLLDGNGTKLTQTGSSLLTIGRWGPGTATLTIQNGATLSTAGPMTINQNGAVNISSGSLIAGGDVLVDGGKLIHSGTFALGSGRSLTAQNGGAVDLLGRSFVVNQGSALNVLGSAEMRNVGNLTVGATSNGSLLVDGAASTLTCFDLSVGTLGANGNAVVRNGATVSARRINVAADSTAGTAGQLTVDSGAQMTFSDALYVANYNGPPSYPPSSPSGAVTVTGANSKLTQTSGNSIFIGSFQYSPGGSAALNVNDGGTFSALGLMTITSTGSLNINGGTAILGPLSLDGGKVNFASGTLQYQGDLVVGPSGMLGGDLSLTPDKSLANTSVSVQAGSRLSLVGGRLSTKTLTNSGELWFSGGQATLNATTLVNNGLVHGDGTIAGSVINMGELRADYAQRLVLAASGNINSGQVYVTRGGTVEAPKGLVNLPMGTIAGDGVLRFGRLWNNTYLVNLGSMAFSGATQIYGDVSVEGSDAAEISVAGGATLSLFGTVAMRNTAGGSPGPEIRVGAGSTAVYFGSLQGDVRLTGAGVHAVQQGLAGNVVNDSTLVLNLGQDFVCPGDISGAGAVVKQGSAGFTLGGNNTYTGATTVSSGTLKVTGSLGNTAVSVSPGAVFAPQPGNGTVHLGGVGPGSAGATLSLAGGAVFDMTDGAVGTVNLRQNDQFSGAALALDGATLKFDLSDSGADRLAVTQGASVGNACTIGISGIGPGLTLGATYPIITAARGVTGTFVLANDVLTVGGHTYRLSLTNSDTAESVTVNPIAAAALAISSPAASFRMMKGQSADVAGKVDNVAGTADLNISLSSTGTLAVSGLTPAAATLAPGAGTTFTGTFNAGSNLGQQSLSVTQSDPAASPGSTVATQLVYVLDNRPLSADAVSAGRVMLNRAVTTNIVGGSGADTSYTTPSVLASVINDLGNGVTLNSGAGGVLNAGQQTRQVSLSFGQTGVIAGSVDLMVLANPVLQKEGLPGESLNGGSAVTLNYSGTVLDNRAVSASPVDFGRVMLTTAQSGASNLTTTGTDNERTRVTVATLTGADANGIAVTGGTGTAFNAADATGMRTLAGTFTGTGLKTGSLTLSITGEGLAGEVPVPVSVGYSATVLDNRAVSAGAVNFGRVMLNTAQSGTSNLTTTGTDNERTRVTVATLADADANGIAITGGTGTAFNAADATGMRTLAGTFTGTGLKTGSLTLSTTGEGLASEVPLTVSVAYSASVLDNRPLTVDAVSAGRVMVNRAVTTNIAGGSGADTSYTTPSVLASVTNDLGNGVTLNSGVGGVLNAGQPTRQVSLSFGQTGTIAGSVDLLTLSNPVLQKEGLAGESLNGGNAVTLNYSATGLDNRAVSASPVDFGRVMLSAAQSGTSNLTTMGTDNERTRVTVATAVDADANGIAITGGTGTAFNAADATGMRTLAGTFTGTGLKTGSLTLSTTGEGLAGEAPIPVSVAYSATVLDNRAVTATPVAFGAVHVGAAATGLTTALSSATPDDRATRVTVANGSDAAVTISGGALSTVFNGTTSDTRAVSGIFGTAGHLAGSVTLTASSAEAGSGLIGEVPANVSVPYTAEVFSGKARWTSADSGSWGVHANWNDTLSSAAAGAPGISGIAGDTALFDTATGTSVALDGANPSLAAITFDSGSRSYSILQGTGGTLTLDKAAAASALVTVLTGRHAISAPLSLTGPTEITVTGGSDVLTLSGLVGGPGSLAKKGSGTLILAGSAANEYAGGTTVEAGALLVNNLGGSGTGSGAVAVHDGGTLGGSGTIGGDVTVASGGTVAPGAGGGSGFATLATSSLTLSGGSTLRLRLGASGAGDMLNVTGGNSGSLNILGPTTVSLSTGGAVEGVYPVIAYNGAWTGSIGSLTVGSPGLGSDYFYEFSDDTTAKQIKLAANPRQWQSGVGGDWGTAGNWLGGVVPDGNTAVARFWSRLAASGSVDLGNTDRTVKTLSFKNATAAYNVTSTAGGRLIMDADAGHAQIVTEAGNTILPVTTISCPIRFNADTDLHGVMTFTGEQDWNGKTITVAMGSAVGYQVTTPGKNTLGARLQINFPESVEVNEGSLCPFSDGVNHMNLTNNGFFVVAASGQRVGNIDGTGYVVIGGTGNLTAADVTQNSVQVAGTMNLVGNGTSTFDQFFIGPLSTLNKSGGGTLNIGADQLHSGGTLNLTGGTTNIAGDCGPGLLIKSRGASTAVNFNAAQNLDSLEIGDGGTVNQTAGALAISRDFTVSGSGGTYNHNALAATIAGEGNTSWAGRLNVAGSSGGSLTFSRTGGTVSVAPGAVIAVGADAALGLGGAVAVLDDGVHRVDLMNDGTVNVTGAGQQVGHIAGGGSTVVTGSGASLTADSIVQNTLSIGAGGSVTIRETAAVTPGASQVPEPSTLVLLIAGASGLLASAWRRRKLAASLPVPAGAASRKRR